MTAPLVLLAEDDDDMRDLIAGHLSSAGMQVVELEDGFELRDYLKQCGPGGGVARPDVVVTDVMMPGETGPEALLHSQFHHAPVVLISSVINPEVRAYAARIGAVAIFQKPFPLKDLVVMIRRLALR